MVEFDGAPWREATVLSSQDRLTIPYLVWRRTPWLGEGGAIALLARTDVPGHLELLPWGPDGQAIFETIKTKVAGTDASTRNRLLLATQDLYARVQADKDRRIVLPTNVLVHLGVQAGQPIHILAQEGRVELASQQYRLDNWRFGDALHGE